jgi:tetratricopeptide (TPR) repeat protein
MYLQALLNLILIKPCFTLIYTHTHKNRKMKYFISCLLFAVTFFTSAQKLTTQAYKNIEQVKHKNIVKQALLYNDAATAINSMHTIIALEGANSSYKDSLALTYFRAKNFVSCHLLTKELLQKTPNNLALLEINAISLQNLRATKEAITAYETLFAKTNNMYHGYQLANLQFDIKRLAEANTTITKVLSCNVLENALLQFNVDKETTQQVPLKAAAYNLQGLLAFQLKDTAMAASAFKAALEITPDFALAKQNREALAKMEQK